MANFLNLLAIIPIFRKKAAEKLVSSKNFSAFSLLELSAAMTVVGVLMVAMFKGGDYLNIARKLQAASQTKNSEIANIPGLNLWLDAVSSNSFNIDDVSLEQGIKISSWNDVNSALPRHLRISAIQLNSNNQPTYVLDGISGIPALSFDGIDDSLFFNSRILNQTDFSIFVVEQRNENGAGRLIGNGNTSGIGDYGDYSLGYEDDNTSNAIIFFGPQAPGNARISVSNVLARYLGEKIPRIHTTTRSQSKGSFYYINSSPIGGSSSLQSKNLLNGYSNVAIAYHRNGVQDARFKGEIGEIIIFSRLLKDSERILVENYLKRKWRIS